MTSSVSANMLKDVDASDVLEYFLNLDTATFPSLTELEKNSNPHTIANLNEALSGDIIIVEKDINELIDALYGRKFKPDQLKGIFGHWLDKAALPQDFSHFFDTTVRGRLTHLENKLITLLGKKSPPHLLAHQKDCGK